MQRFLAVYACMAAFVSTGCINGSSISCPEGSPIEFAGEIDGWVLHGGSYGTGALLDTDTEWSEGDAVGIYMLSAGGTMAGDCFEGSANIRHRYIGKGGFTAHSSSEAFFWPEDGALVDFVAYYPYHDDVHTSVYGHLYPLDVAAQTNLAAIDFMYSDNAMGLTKGRPLLGFRHKLAKLVFNVSVARNVAGRAVGGTAKSMAGGVRDAIEGMSVEIDEMPTRGTFNLASGMLSVADGVAGNAVISPVRVGGGESDGSRGGDDGKATFEAIVLPGEGFDFNLVFGFSDGERVTRKMADVEYLSGYKYIYNLTIDVDSEGRCIVTGNAGIVDWNSDDDGGSDLDVGKEPDDSRPVPRPVIVSASPALYRFSNAGGTAEIKVTVDGDNGAALVLSGLKGILDAEEEPAMEATETTRAAYGVADTVKTVAGATSGVARAEEELAVSEEAEATVGSGLRSVIIRAQPNPVGARAVNQTLTIALGGSSVSVWVSVDAGEVPPPVLLLDSGARVRLPAGGGSASIGFTVENPVDGVFASVSTDSPEWITFLSSATNNEIVRFDVTENDGEARSGVITIGYPGSDAPLRVTVLQAAASVETPLEQYFSETFGQARVNGVFAVADYDEWDETGVFYSGTVRVMRTLNTDYHLWFSVAGAETVEGMEAVGAEPGVQEFVISGLPSGYTDITLGYDVSSSAGYGNEDASGMGNGGEAAGNAGMIRVFADGSDKNLAKSVDVPLSGQIDAPERIRIDIPDGITSLRFVCADDVGPVDIHLDNIEIEGRR